MTKSVVAEVLVVLTVMIFVPQLWVLTMNVAPKVPLELDIVVVMFWCVPKSMVTVPQASKPTPFMVITVPTEPADGPRKVIAETSLKVVFACSFCVLAVIKVVGVSL